jgi:hypothetical protein
MICLGNVLPVVLIRGNQAGQKRHLVQHVKSVHDNVRDFKCNVCDFAANQKGNLVQHVKSNHDKVRDFKCNVCDFAASLKGNLATHVNIVHAKADADKKKCPDCKYATQKDKAQGPAPGPSRGRGTLRRM